MPAPAALRLNQRSAKPRWLLMTFALGALVALAACGDDEGPAKGPLGGDDAGPPDGATPDAGGGDAAVEDAGPDPVEPNDAGAIDAGATDAGEPDAGEPGFGGLIPNTPWDELEIDLLGTPGHRIWIEVSEQQLSRMNAGSGGGFPGPMFDGLGRQLEAGDALYQQLARDMNPDLRFDPFFGDDIYTPGHPATFADHVIVQDALSERVADYGKMEVKLVGESTARAWDFAHIPNIRIDSNEFENGKRIGGVEHVRLNNGLVGSIFRELIAHRIFRALDYPALRGSWAFLGSNVWGNDIWVPMVLIEVYKRRFCEENAELLGGACQNMWEFPGYVGDLYGGAIPESACQVDGCDNTRLEALIDQLTATPRGAGFKQALEPYIDWDRFHQFQCLSWMLWTGDDALHNGNNNLIIERDTDGKLIWAPYSVDISAGQGWYPNVPLTGTAPIALGCQAEPECWADTIAACEDLIVKFDALEPEAIVDESVDTLTQLGMMRAGDEERAELLRTWYVERQLQLPDELERFRHLPDEFGNCPDGLELCGDGGCGTPEQCVSRSCALGQTWCQSREACIDALHESCPECTEQAPRFCHLNHQCVASDEDCWATCAATPGMTYCAAYDSCVFEGECPDDDDGGVVVPPPWER